ncbi:hypothetical protein SAMN05192564_107177 [Paraburkholderia sartisoli]|uniref:Uncharacterized protein n=1 Tax=Paraburkholderia sartisoli TaxID=83784 RepID=A0A1H4H3S6_9BURK|nr:hypothetical protein SAMN05192564_107177 [Paraburkholderia sartisoli]
MLHADRAFSPVRRNARVLPPRARFFMGAFYMRAFARASVRRRVPGFMLAFP